MTNNNFTLKDDIQEKLELYELTQDKIGIDITNLVLFNTIQQSKYFNHNHHLPILIYCSWIISFIYHILIDSGKMV